MVNFETRPTGEEHPHNNRSTLCKYRNIVPICIAFRSTFVISDFNYSKKYSKQTLYIIPSWNLTKM